MTNPTQSPIQPEKDGKTLRKKYGIFGLSIIQLVGIIFVAALIATIAYQ